MKKYMKLAVPVVLALAAIYACNKLSVPEITDVSGDNPMYVSIDEAESMLLEIMDRMDAIGTKSDGGSVRRTISGRYSKIFSDATKSGDEVPVVHVFNFEDESGFAIMSADRRVAPMLAFAFKGCLEAGDPIDNPGLAIYMSKLNNYISRLTLDTLSSDQVIDQDDLIYGDVYVTEMVSGYCPVKWNQSYPYNYLCPVDSALGLKCLTGCTATAVAQLMACYKYPESYNGYTFDWDSMIEASNAYELPVAPPVEDPEDPINIGDNDSTKPPISAGSIMYEPEPDSAIFQVARLMQQLGLPENLNNFYTPYATYTSSSAVGTTLKNFGFSESEIIDFIELLNELRSGYYCFVHAEGYEGDDLVGSHCWLLHGLMTVKYYNVFNETYYFLCNFGWGGLADGYYLAEVFNMDEGPVFPDVKSSEEGSYYKPTIYQGRIRKLNN